MSAPPLLFVKTPDSWKIVYEHLSVPPDRPMKHHTPNMPPNSSKTCPICAMAKIRAAQVEEIYSIISGNPALS